MILLPNSLKGFEARNPKVWDLNIFLPQLRLPASKKSDAAHARSSTSQHLEILWKSLIGINWLEPNWHRRCHNPAGLRRQLNLTWQSIKNMSSCPCNPFPHALQKVCRSLVNMQQNTTYNILQPVFKDAFSSLDAMRSENSFQRQTVDLAKKSAPQPLRPGATKRWDGEHLSFKGLKGVLELECLKDI